MGDAPLILGVSGLRGIVGESLTPEVAVRYARAIGAWLSANDPYEDCFDVVIAHDGRAGHELVYQAAIAGLLASGWGVRPLGRAMTPTVGCAVDADPTCAGGVIVTASHNPQEWNGLKCISAVHGEGGGRTRASAPPARLAVEIVDQFTNNNFTRSDPVDAPVDGVDKGSFRKARQHDESPAARSQHARKVRNAAGAAGCLLTPSDDWRSRARVVVDSVNSSGSEATRLLLEDLEVGHVQLHGDDSGIFPHTPEPTAENLSGEGGLCDAVPGLKADVGFAQDPDGDRLAIVDERGVYIGEEYTLAIAAEAILGAMGDDAKGAVLVTNLSTSRMIEDVAAAYGARVERTAVGEANVVERMKALKAAGQNCVLGGEGNGGVIWPEVTYVRDSLGAMALTLGLMAREGKTVSQLVEQINAYAPAGGYTIVKRKQALATKADAAPAVHRIADRYADQRVDTQDGVRVDFDAGPHAGSWVHVRASNTEPILRLIAEAANEAKAAALLDEVAAIVNEP